MCFGCVNIDYLPKVHSAVRLPVSFILVLSCLEMRQEGNKMSKNGIYALVTWPPRLHVHFNDKFVSIKITAMQA